MIPLKMMIDWSRAILGRTARDVGRLGISASYGVPASGVHMAFERGVNYLYWGTFRRGAFGQALRDLKPQRDRMFLLIQSYSRMASLIAPSLERALRAIGYEYADGLLLGMWNHAASPRIMDACRRLRERGLIRHIAMSVHSRPLVPELAASDIDIFHVRYNAVHIGAERDIFPKLSSNGARPGMVAFAATSWRQLLNPKKTLRGQRTPTAVDCYRFVMSNPGVDVCMTGPSTEAHAREMLEALDRGPMGNEELVWMRRVGAAIYAN
jgi:aryl-alcohol dehydrogenase-like predicted oxidoreductase